MHRMLPRTPTWKLAAAGLAALAVVGVLAYPYLAPKPTLAVDQAAPEGRALLQGAFRDGAPGHTVRGTVQVVQGPGGAFLRLENYEATSGPDVYFYLSPVANPATTEDVERGVLVRVPGGEDDGEATLRGNFNVPLPAGVDPAAYRSLVAWCDRFNVNFGWAPLAAA